MIRVLHVVSNMDYGGVETLIMNVYRRIDREKVQFDFMVNGYENCDYAREIKKLGGRIFTVTPKRESLIKNVRDTIRVMKNHPKINIVHIHDDSNIGFSVFSAKRAGAKKIITHAHTTSEFGIRAFTAKLFRRYIRKNAHIMCACSLDAAKWIYGKKAVENNTVRIYRNAIDLDKFKFNKQVRNEIREKWALKDKLVIGSVGRMFKVKNQQFLLNIALALKELFSDFKIVLIGNGPDYLKIKQEVARLNLDNYIMLMGKRNDVNEFMQVFDVFVLPSLYEGFPLVCIEAMASGLPIILSDGIPKEVDILGKIKFHSLNDPISDWTDDIIKINTTDRKDNFDKLKSAGFLIDDVSEQWVQMYENFLV